jgi:hypothetical protein
VRASRPLPSQLKQLTVRGKINRPALPRRVMALRTKTRRLSRPALRSQRGGRVQLARPRIGLRQANRARTDFSVRSELRPTPPEPEGDPPRLAADTEKVPPPSDAPARCRASGSRQSQGRQVGTGFGGPSARHTGWYEGNREPEGGQRADVRSVRERGTRKVLGTGTPTGCEVRSRSGCCQWWAKEPVRHPDSPCSPPRAISVGRCADCLSMRERTSAVNLAKLTRSG